MARRRKKLIPTTILDLEIERVSHDGRGISHHLGKTLFVEGALPGETVKAKYIDTHSKYDELAATDIANPSQIRVTPPCQHANVCGGCSLQHMDTQAQIALKQEVLLEQFKHFGGISTQSLQAPMTGQTTGYRRKARLGVRYVTKRDEVLVGFREKHSSFLTAIDRCEVLDPRIGRLIPELRQLIRGLTVYNQLPQIEVAMGDDKVALIFRHMAPLTTNDLQQLCGFGETHDIQIYLQPKGPDTVHLIYPENAVERLSYRLDEFAVELKFHPMDFTQVNADINQKMLSRAIEWLDPCADDRVLDLFCGLGNFTIPLATRAGQVVGVEGDETMVVRGRENAKHNQLDNVRFYAANLQADFTKESWASEGFTKILIDPPRSGALDVVQYLPAFGAGKIVYVSCNPATLARDAGVLVEHGYTLLKTGVMDMFPHTTHVESIALFERSGSAATALLKK
jgi:23S rRNA (uracil1939-C5)-methyltransferase